MAFDEEQSETGAGPHLVSVQGIKMEVLSINGEDNLHSVSGEQSLAISGGDLDEALKEITGVANKVTTSLRDAGPTKISVELGLGFEAKPGKLVGLIVDPKASCTFKIKLEWDNS